MLRAPSASTASLWARLSDAALRTLLIGPEESLPAWSWLFSWIRICLPVP
jgi:hypothetical protein